MLSCSGVNFGTSRRMNSLLRNILKREYFIVFPTSDLVKWPMEPKTFLRTLSVLNVKIFLIPYFPRYFKITSLFSILFFSWYFPYPGLFEQKRSQFVVPHASSRPYEASYDRRYQVSSNLGMASKIYWEEKDTLPSHTLCTIVGRVKWYIVNRLYK